MPIVEPRAPARTQVARRPVVESDVVAFVSIPDGVQEGVLVRVKSHRGKIIEKREKKKTIEIIEFSREKE